MAYWIDIEINGEMIAENLQGPIAHDVLDFLQRDDYGTWKVSANDLAKFFRTRHPARYDALEDDIWFDIFKNDTWNGLEGVHFWEKDLTQLSNIEQVQAYNRGDYLFGVRLRPDTIAVVTVS